MLHTEHTTPLIYYSIVIFVLETVVCLKIRLNVSRVMTSETGVTGMDMRWGRNSKVRRSIEFLDEIFLEGSDGIHEGVARSVDTHSTKQRTDTIE